MRYSGSGTASLSPARRRSVVSCSFCSLRSDRSAPCATRHTCSNNRKHDESTRWSACAAPILSLSSSLARWAFTATVSIGSRLAQSCQQDRRRAHSFAQPAQRAKREPHATLCAQTEPVAVRISYLLYLGHMSLDCIQLAVYWGLHPCEHSQQLSTQCAHLNVHVTQQQRYLHGAPPTCRRDSRTILG
jgi:hypothetical protein